MITAHDRVKFMRRIKTEGNWEKIFQVQCSMFKKPAELTEETEMTKTILPTRKTI